VARDLDTAVPGGRDQASRVMSRPLVRRIGEFTLGNPLFVLELGRALLERGIPGIGHDIPVPEGIDDMLGTRVAGLAAPVRRGSGGDHVRCGDGGTSVEVAAAVRDGPEQTMERATSRPSIHTRLREVS
jgi:hypothetical protein